MGRRKETEVSGSARESSGGAWKPAGPIVITGVSGYWGTRAARALTAAAGPRSVIAVDHEPPFDELGPVEYVPLSLKSPSIVDLLIDRKVDTLVHLVLKGDSVGRERMFEENVMGTRYLLAACRVAGVRRFVAKSSAAVYGALPDNPNFLTEDRPLRARTRFPFIRDFGEMESLYSHHRRTAKGAPPSITVLRFANIVGPTCRTWTTRYLRERALVSVMGFDPLLQFIHEDDVVGAITHACRTDVSGGGGAFNIAADGVFPLSMVAAKLGKSTVPMIAPLIPTLTKAAKFVPGVVSPALPPDFLRYLWVVDTARMKNVLGYQPRYSGKRALELFASELRIARRPHDEASPPMTEFVARCLDEVLEPDEPAPSGA